MDYRNVIPGMKVLRDGRPTYIVRMAIRYDERINRKRQEVVVNSRLSEMEGQYEKAENLTLLELPKSFSKRNQEYNRR